MNQSIESNADVAQNNELRILLLVQGAARIKVIDTATHAVLLAIAASLTLALVEVVAGDVGHEVVGPSDKLLPDEHGQSVNGSLLSELGDLMKKAANALGVILSSARNEDHVTLHMSSGLVVLAVGDLPAEVWNEESRMEEPASCVVDQARRGEGAVAALVGNDPEPSPKESLHGCVQAPEDETSGLAGDIIGSDEVVEDVEGGGKTDNVAKNVCPAAQSRSFEAVLGNGIANVLDCVVGGGEVVAIRVDQVGVLGLGLGIHVDRGEGGERSRGG